MPRVAERLMKGSRLSDNLFLVGLSVNPVDSISRDLTVSGCTPSSIGLPSDASEKGGENERDGEIECKRGRGVNNGWPFYCMNPP